MAGTRAAKEMGRYQPVALLQCDRGTTSSCMQRTTALGQPTPAHIGGVCRHSDSRYAEYAGYRHAARRPLSHCGRCSCCLHACCKHNPGVLAIAGSHFAATQRSGELAGMPAWWGRHDGRPNRDRGLVTRQYW